jgi:DNA-binding NarL/FixJ family response regulator
MITVAIATRTMDRQARYRSLLPVKDFAIVSVLDCPTLVQMVKSRPVDVIIFDLQRPAMPAEDWLEIIDNDPDLKFFPIAWVGRDVPQSVLAMIKTLADSEIVPPRPEAQVLVEVITRLATKSSLISSSLKPAEQAGWQPPEDIIDDALSIFDQSPENGKPLVVESSRDEWQVSELAGATPPPKPEQSASGETEDDEEVQPFEKAPTEESSITLDSEEIGTGKFGVAPGKSPTTHPALINEKIISITTRPGRKITGPELVEHITQKVLENLAARLADELLARIDQDQVRNMVRETLSASESDSAGHPSPSSS